MSLQQEHGKWGEDLAADFLRQSGLTILHRNWRYQRAEVDLIATDSTFLVFIEVKVRAYTAFGRPEEMVGQAKQKLLFAAANAYAYQAGYTSEIRFDIISIIGVPGRVEEILHFRDAFFPGLGFGEKEGR